jgi:hypothetical protein
MRRKDTEEMRFLRAVAGHRIVGHKCNEYITEELETTDINKIMK